MESCLGLSPRLLAHSQQVGSLIRVGLPCRKHHQLPRGVAVVVEALHMCMLMRGVEKQNSKAVTSAMLGAFRDRPETRAEFMELIKSRSGLVI